MAILPRLFAKPPNRQPSSVDRELTAQLSDENRQISTLATEMINFRPDAPFLFIRAVSN